MLRSACSGLRGWLPSPRVHAGLGAATAAAAAAAAAVAATAALQTAPAAGCAGMTANRVLGEGRHRVALTAWPINDDPCGHFTTPEQLFAHAKRAGYDGLELTVDDFRKSFFPGQSYENIITKVKALSRSTGVQIVGSLYHVSDGGWRREHEDGAPGRWDLDFNEADFYAELARRVALDKALGSEYVTFQISLPPQYLNTGGEYRDDAAFIKRSAERIAKMQQVCFEQGVNFYVETRPLRPARLRSIHITSSMHHANSMWFSSCADIDRVSEDVVGFARIMDACPTYFEVNADISHYVYRGIKKGNALAKILARVGTRQVSSSQAHASILSAVLGVIRRAHSSAHGTRAR
jgi:sugar phosphate isomerase/epimerase